jgi:class I fructose-bisphosphate aldolase
LSPLEAGADTFAGAIPTILKLDSANSLPTNKDQAVTASVADALRLAARRSASRSIPARKTGTR